jgi:hypothetical protein
MHRIYHGFFELFSSAANKKKNNSTQQQYYNTNGKAPFKKQTNITQEKIDLLLDKINKEGMESLTDEEKQFLNRVSEQA